MTAKPCSVKARRPYFMMTLDFMEDEVLYGLIHTLNRCNSQGVTDDDEVATIPKDDEGRCPLIKETLSLKPYDLIKQEDPSVVPSSFWTSLWSIFSRGPLKVRGMDGVPALLINWGIKSKGDCHLFISHHSRSTQGAQPILLDKCNNVALR